MERSATVTWQGPLKEGLGWITTKSHAIHDVSFNYDTRFKDDVGTNPEELIAAAHASCYSMALAGFLEIEGFKAIDLHTTATVALEYKNNEWSISSSHIDVGADIPNISDSKFQALAEKTKNNCPISRLLKAEITVNAKLWTKERIKSAKPMPGEL